MILDCVKVTVETNQDSSYNNYGNKISFSALSLKKKKWSDTRIELSEQMGNVSKIENPSDNWVICGNRILLP